MRGSEQGVVGELGRGSGRGGEGRGGDDAQDCLG